MADGLAYIGFVGVSLQPLCLCTGVQGVCISGGSVVGVRYIYVGHHWFMMTSCLHLIGPHDAIMDW